MKSLRLQKLHLMSDRERRARTIDFHPKATVIKGGNDVGKSSVAKSIFEVLGAEAAVVHPRWRSAGAISLLEFTIDDVPYFALRDGSTYTLFNEHSTAICSYTSITTGLGPALADLLNFRLQLKARNGSLVQAPPAFCFLPFYCDQDKGWGDTWSSFARLAQFPNWKMETISYHVGITTPEYYSALAKLAKADLERVDPQKALDGLLLIKKKAASSDFHDLDVEIDSAVFAEEIDLLVQRASEVAEVRERKRVAISELSNQRIQVLAQKEILERARSELHADYVFATEELADDIECPTCGQMHSNSFAQRFSIAQDEARAGDLLTEILDRLASNEEQLSIARRSLADMTSQEAEVHELLSRKRGQVTFARLLERAGQKAFSAQLEEQIRELSGELAQIDGRIMEARAAIEASKSVDRKQMVGARYVSLMSDYLRHLSVTSLSEKDYSRLDFVIKETGSDRPRAVLAYMFAILHLIWESPSSIRCPVVLDSPNQQDQDPENHVRMLEFIRDFRPEDSQLVLFAVDDCGVDFGGEVKVLDEEDFALSAAMYDDVSRIVNLHRASRDLL